MDTIELSKKGSFDMAHRLPDYDGACSRLHGHTWNWKVEIYGEMHIPSKSNMLVDFGKIKTLMNEFDHYTLLSIDDPLMKLITKSIPEHIDVYGILPVVFVPTCENLTRYFVDRLVNTLTPDGELYELHVRLCETPGSCVERHYIK